MSVTIRVQFPDGRTGEATLDGDGWHSDTPNFAAACEIMSAPVPGIDDEAPMDYEPDPHLAAAERVLLWTGGEIIDHTPPPYDPEVVY